VTTYYLNRAGSGTGDGSIGDPWKDFSEITGLVSGDSVLLNRGDTWTDQLTISYTGITFDAYGSGALPIINKRAAIPGWDTGGNWTDMGSDQWRFDLVSAINTSLIGRVWLGSAEILAAQVGTDVDATNKYSISDIDGDAEGGNYLWLYATSNPAGGDQVDASNISSGTPRGIAFTGTSAGNTVRNIEVRGGNTAIRFGSSGNGNIVENCTIGLYSAAGIVIRNGSTHIVRNNTMASGGDLTYAFASAFKCEDGILVAASTGATSNGNLIYNNTITNWGHNGVYIQCLNSGTANNNLVYDNDVSAANISYGRGLGCDATTTGSCDSTEFYRNLSHSHSVKDQINGTNTKFYNNLVYDIPRVVVGIGWSSTDFAKGQGIGVGAGASDVTGILIYNNTFYNIADAGVQLSSDTYDQTGTKIENNIFFECGNDPFDAQNNISMFIENDFGDVLNTTMNNNLCFSTTRGLGADEVDYNNDFKTLAEMEANLIPGDVAANNINVDPLLVNPSADMHLLWNSPCEKTGLDVGLTDDYDQFPVSVPPDIGAYALSAKNNESYGSQNNNDQYGTDALGRDNNPQYELDNNIGYDGKWNEAYR
jgi:hypothetical protein